MRPKINIILPLFAILTLITLVTAEKLSVSNNGVFLEAEAAFIKQRQLLYYRNRYGGIINQQTNKTIKIKKKN